MFYRHAFNQVAIIHHVILFTKSAEFVEVIHAICKRMLYVVYVNILFCAD